MLEPTIRECATTNCTNTWEVWDEDDARHEVCGECEIETQAQTPITHPGIGGVRGNRAGVTPGTRAHGKRGAWSQRKETSISQRTSGWHCR